MDITNDKSVADYLRKFHTNVTNLESAKDEIAEKFGISFEESGEFLDAVREGKALAFANEDNSMVVFFQESDTLPLSVIKSNAELIKESLGLMDFNPIPNTGNSPRAQPRPQAGCTAGSSPGRDCPRRRRKNSRRAQRQGR